MEKITGALFLTEEAQLRIAGGRESIAAASHMIMLTSMSTCMSTLIAWGGSTCDHDSTAVSD